VPAGFHTYGLTAIIEGQRLNPEEYCEVDILHIGPVFRRGDCSDDGNTDRSVPV
jgi:hypothetical protein